MFRSLIRRFAQSAESYPARPALVVEGQSISYLRLKRLATRISQTILQYQEDDSPLVAVLGSRTITVYAAILGAHAAGKGYVPLNPKFPAERTRTMLRLSGTRVVVADHKGCEQLPDVLAGLGQCLTIILPDTVDASKLSSVFPEHRFIPSGRLENARDDIIDSEPNAVAYLLFTSGSTGQPKGVPIRQSNVHAYVDYVVARYDVSEQDRFSQEFELTFDLSVHDMFVCWERGACLYCVPEKHTMFPAKFIRDNQLTMWFSVPSVVGALARVKLLQPGCFPSLRWSLFCGEPLSVTYASLWQDAAPDSAVENLYGPTETTIAISHYRWDRAGSPAECLNGIVPIGWVFEGQHCRVVDSHGGTVRPGEMGELCLQGSQVASGYWNDRQKTSQQFVQLRGDPDGIRYSTGDLVKQHENGCLFYLGRIDQQVKVRGYRIELQELELVLRRICRTEQAVAVPWPVREGTAEGLVAFVCGMDTLDEGRVLQACREILPDYMVPKAVCLVGEIPLNQNGKTDRRKLIQTLGGGIRENNSGI
jgi:amino acid adenylation domain-containing protein